MEPRRAASPGEAGTVERILDGALRAAARRGLQKLSMSDIGDSANVSRGTLYRYFASKDDVIDALPDHLLLRWKQHLRQAVAQQPRPEERVRVVMEAITGYATASPELLRMIQLEPEFGLDFLERKLPDSVRIVADVLEPVIEDAAVVHARVITGPELAEILLRIAMSGFLVPGTRTRQLPKRVANFWDYVNVGVDVAAEEGDRAKRMAAVAQLPRDQRRRHA
ncbi:TetR/AcrR family transcriptional regulator [Streptomyces sp. NPDC055400]